eukprot:2026490-Pleurochrysis_carterae.AAC.4
MTARNCVWQACGKLYCIPSLKGLSIFLLAPRSYAYLEWVKALCASICAQGHAHSKVCNLPRRLVASIGLYPWAKVISSSMPAGSLA